MIIVPGPVQLWAGGAICKVSGSSGSVDLSSMERLGQTENGVQISISNRAHRVNVDDMGGTSGAPAELINLGASASIRGVMVDYGPPNAATDSDAKRMLWAIARGLRYPWATDGIEQEGDIAAPGTPLFEFGYGFSFFLIGVGASYYFPRCEFASAPREWNVSSTERKTSFTCTAYEIPVINNGANAGRILYYDSPSVENGTGISYVSCRTTSHSGI